MAYDLLHLNNCNFFLFQVGVSVRSVDIFKFSIYSIQRNDWQQFSNSDSRSETWFEFDKRNSCMVFSHFMWNSWKLNLITSSVFLSLSFSHRILLLFSFLHVSFLVLLCDVCILFYFYFYCQYIWNTYYIAHRCGKRGGGIQNNVGFISGKWIFFCSHHHQCLGKPSPMHFTLVAGVSYFICLNFSWMCARVILFNFSHFFSLSLSLIEIHIYIKIKYRKCAKRKEGSDPSKNAKVLLNFDGCWPWSCAFNRANWSSIYDIFT